MTIKICTARFAGRFSNDGGVLLVITSLGIDCQNDESNYGYKQVNGRWQKVA